MAGRRALLDERLEAVELKAKGGLLPNVALLHGSTGQAQSSSRSDIYGRRTYSGRPSSIIRFSEATAMATSVVCRPSVRECSASPITRL
jgi:hypothetical protein